MFQFLSFKPNNINRKLVLRAVESDNPVVEDNAAKQLNNANEAASQQNTNNIHTSQLNTIKLDPIYKSRLVTRLQKTLLKQGKEEKAEKIITSCFEILLSKTQEPGISIFKESVFQVTPLVEIKPFRRGGSVIQVPVEVSAERGTGLALKWIVEGAKKRVGSSMALKLSLELLDASQKTGYAWKKKEELYRLAESNKAFSHLKV
jgi:small subunit ribosomal protein S7